MAPTPPSGAAIASDPPREPPSPGVSFLPSALRPEERQLLRAELAAYARAASEHEPFATHRSGDAFAHLLLPPVLRAALAPWWRARALGWFERAAPGL